MWSLCLRSYLHNEFTDWLTDVLYCSSFLHETFCHRINSLLVLCGSTLRTFWNADANCSLFIITFITLIYWPNVWSKLNVSLTPHKDDTIPNWLSFKLHKFLETDRGTSWKRTTLRLLVNILRRKWHLTSAVLLWQSSLQVSTRKMQPNSRGHFDIQAPRRWVLENLQ